MEDPAPNPPSVPLLTTTDPTYIWTRGATSGGNVTDEGGGTVTDRGICWATTEAPVITDNHLHSGSGLGAFTIVIGGLTRNTTYHVRAFATNASTTSYGYDYEFTTPIYSALGDGPGKVYFSGGKVQVIE
jgi:hypothetical protein